MVFNNVIWQYAGLDIACFCNSSWPFQESHSTYFGGVHRFETTAKLKNNIHPGVCTHQNKG